MKEQMTMMNELIEAIKEDEKFLPGIADLLWKFYNELMAVGFTKEEAVKIVSNYNIGK